MQEDNPSDPSAATPPAPAVPKKRGRPSKLDGLAAAAQELERAGSDDDSLDQPPRPDDEPEPAVERPKKRTRFSLADTTVDEGGGENEQSETRDTPAEPVRRRGRSSGPPLVPGPELDGAPVRVPPPPSTADQTLATASIPTPRRQTRKAVPVVEVPAPSRAKTPKRKDAPSKEPRLEPPSPSSAPQDSPEPDPLNPRPAQLDAPPQTTTSTSNEEPTVAPTPPPNSRFSLPPRHPTPAASSSKSKAAASTTQAKTKSKSRKSVTSKDNLTALTRQKETLDYVTSRGGIIDAVPRLGEFIRDHARSTNSSAQVFTMDRHVVNSTLSTLVKREHLRKTSVVGVKGDRHDIYYFPTFTLESPEMVEFLDKTLNKKEVIPHWDKFDRANDIVIDELSQRIGDVGQPVQSQGGAKGGEGISANGRRGGGALPGPGDDPATVKDYFRRQSIVVGASYGARYGPYSRARQLHKWLARITYSGESSPLIAHKDDDGFVLTHDTFVSAMPLVIFTSIVPLPIESDELRQFLDDPSHLSLPLSLVPSNILSVLRPSLNKRKQAVWNTISTLMKFKLLSPLVEASGPSRSQRSFVTPVQAQSATHWRFNTTVPVYSFAQDEAPLVSLANLDSVDAVRQYWTSLQRYATILIDPLPMEEPAKLEGSGYPLKFDGIGAFVKRLRLKSKWKDGYHFLPDQRKFLTNLVTTDPNLVNSNQDRSNEIEVWADALFAPVNVVVEYLQLSRK